MTPDALQERVWQLVKFGVAAGVVLLLGAILVALLAPSVSAPLTDAGGDEAGETDRSLHENPDELGSEINLEGLEGQLSANLREELEQVAANLDPEDYEDARDQVGDEQFEQLMAEYEEVATQLGHGDDHQYLLEAQRAQLNNTDHIAAYWELYETYTRVNTYERLEDSYTPSEGTNDHPLTRTMARHLEDRASLANESAHVAMDRYETMIEELGEDDYESVIAAIEASKANVTDTQHTVRETHFIPTNLTLEAANETISPTAPLTVAGQLQTADGPVANDSVAFDVGEQTIETNTTADGEFTFEYIPTALPANETTLAVRYHPDSASVHLDDTATLPVSVERATPTVTAEASPDRAVFTETVTVTGAVTVDEVGMPAVPYHVLVDGELLAENTTAADGSIETDVSLPADVEAGEQDLEVRLPLETRAIEPETGQTTLRVDTQESVFSIDTSIAEETITVEGLLATPTDDPIDNQTVHVAVNGSAVGSMTTDANGTLEQTFAVPDEVLDDDETVAVEVSFDGTGTNLESTSATSIETMPASAGFGMSVLWLALPVGLLALAGSGLYLVRWRRSSTVGSDTSPDPMATTTQVSEQSQPTLEGARDRLEAGEPAAAIQHGYATLRHRLAGDRPVARGHTHWELYEEHAGAFDPAAQAAFRTAIETYERATFTPEGADETMARTTLESIETVTAQAPTSGGE